MSGPLRSWDIFIDLHWRNIANAKDLTLIKTITKKYGWKTKLDFQGRLVKEKKVIIITDIAQNIVFASNNVHSMTGYFPDEITSNTPRMFQGKETSLHAKMAIKNAIEQLSPFCTSLINYRKDGSTYNCEIEGIPIKNKANQYTHFVAFEKQIYGMS
ncbi:MAG: PAS domain-containing protein [Flavipsychrobacter sp.]|nr:PAS domain-containing protein [Flavipsychrobacter sp.]